MWKNNVVLESIRADKLGNIYFVCGDTFGVVNKYASFHFDRRTGDLNTIAVGMSFEDAMKTVGLYREGIRP